MGRAARNSLISVLMFLRFSDLVLWMNIFKLLNTDTRQISRHLTTCLAPLLRFLPTSHPRNGGTRTFPS